MNKKWRVSWEVTLTGTTVFETYETDESEVMKRFVREFTLPDILDDSDPFPELETWSAVEVKQK